jgi:hypothetical protein
MARALVTKTTALGAYAAYTGNAADLTMAAANVADKNYFVAGGNDLVVAHNTGVGAVTVTITSVADPFGRTGDVTAYSMAAGEYAVFGPFKNLGWAQSNGQVYLEASSADVKFGVVAVPN